MNQLINQIKWFLFKKNIENGLGESPNYALNSLKYFIFDYSGSRYVFERAALVDILSIAATDIVYMLAALAMFMPAIEIVG